MQSEDSKNSNESISESLKDENKNIACKDGFCFIPNLQKNQSINNENINIFDPI